MNRHTSSTDTLAGVIIPILVSALAISTAAFSYKAIKTAPSVFEGYLVLVAPLLLITLLVAFYILKPLYISADADALTIHRMVGPVSFHYTTICSISILSNKDMSGAMRTFGNGGLFGYTGKYYNSRFGKMTWYCTQRNNYVLLILSDKKKIVITPDNPAELLIDLRKCAPADMVINS
jgi:hypothetical protein